MKLLLPLPHALIIEVSIGDGCFSIRVCAHRPASHIVTIITEGSNQEKTKMQLQVGVNKGSILNSPQSDDGVERAVDGPIISHDTPHGIVSLAPSPDGKTVDVIPVAAGSAVIVATADADLTAADVQISGNAISVEVTGTPVKQATHIVSTEGPVIPQ